MTLDAIAAPTPTTTLEGTLAALREAEVRLMADIATTLAEVGDNAAEDRRRLLDVAQDLREMFFMVAVIGEFNAGKSSFINALLGDDLLPVGVTPTTEAVELIRYSETPQRKPSVREDGIREWAHPNTGAPGVALVDTPGTGSVFQKHEKTAKAFLHRSDFVLFVISAKRAFAETERLYLELAKSYGKKVILIVNQIDLLQPNEQYEVRRFVERQVAELLDLHPLIFMVSAKEALAARRDGIASGAGGVDAVKAHLRGVFNEAPPAKQKLLAQLEMAERVLKRYMDDAQGRVALVGADTARVRDVQRELENQAAGLDTQLRDARVQIDAVFDGVRQRGQQFISNNLSLKRIGRPVNKEMLQAEFQQVVIGGALRDINEATSDYINALIDNSRLYWRGVIDRLNQLQAALEQELGGLDAGVYAEQRENLQEAIRIAESELKSYSTGKVLDELQATFESNMNGFTTSAVAAIGGLLVAIAAVAAQGPLVGVAAAAFAVAVPIALGGGFLAVRYYRRVTADTRKDLNARVDQLQQTYHEALNRLTQKERNRLTQYGNQVLTPVFSRLDVLAKRYADQQAALRTHEEAIATLRKGIEDVK